MEYGAFGCGGSYFEGFCPNGMYCPTPAQIIPCKSATEFCPTGVTKALSCPAVFDCIEGRAERQRIIITVMTTVAVILFVVIIFALPISAKLFKWISEKLFKRMPSMKKWFGKHKLSDPFDVSEYFQEPPEPNYEPEKCIKLHVHLKEAKLRDVKRFDRKKNQGFTSRITPGKITALMGGSGCGKSSLLETIYGRRRLRPGGSITFANHKPLSHILTDYVGYVPQADIMHNDLTVFETVYYSARARRLGGPKQTLINDVYFVLKKLGLGDMHDDFIKTLSGGQRKRVNVALEVVACPKVLLLDEPTSGLDTVSCDELFELLQLIKCSKAGPVTIVTVIHQPSHELFEKIDNIFFLTRTCCLAYQGPRSHAKNFLEQKIFPDSQNIPPPRHNDCDTCIIMLTKAKDDIKNHRIESQRIAQSLTTYSWSQRAWYPFFYVLRRSIRQIYIRGVVAEVAYMLAYFLLGFSPTKEELRPFGFVVVLSFSRHVQSLLFQQESKLYLEDVESKDHIWGTSVEGLAKAFDFNNSENPTLCLVIIGFSVRFLTYMFLYRKSEYRSKARFYVTNPILLIKNLLTAKSCRDRSVNRSGQSRPTESQPNSDQIPLCSIALSEQESGIPCSPLDTDQHELILLPIR
ncbi:unnamed protein product [Adineta steineri]|uniref:ABC transporter domain-containing protein n=1 Tax=Adineta steineri TaxID=433720 RepID=A0A814U3E4_9BILA|nr:unnamed protein product [Adineta steineri]CAF1169371.1 unnamed protein product [Adineta steineri]